MSERMLTFLSRVVLDAPWSSFFPSDIGMEAPARKRKRGKMRSKNVNPAHWGCWSCVVAQFSHCQSWTVARVMSRVFPPAIQNMSSPRSASIEWMRGVVSGWMGAGEVSEVLFI